MAKSGYTMKASDCQVRNWGVNLFSAVAKEVGTIIMPFTSVRLAFDDGISVRIILVCDTLHNTAQAFCGSGMSCFHLPSPHR